MPFVRQESSSENGEPKLTSREVALQKNPAHPMALALWMKENEGVLSKAELQRTTGLAKRSVTKFLWLSTIPEVLQVQILRYPKIFSARVLVAGFASRQKFYEQNDWRALKREVERLVREGDGATPRKARDYPRGRAGGSFEAQRRRATEGISEPPAPPPRSASFLDELTAKERLREMLSTLVEVSSGEIRIKYFGKEDLERIMETLEGGSSLDAVLGGRS